MSSLSEIRSALRLRLLTVSNLRGYDLWPKNVEPPAAIVKPVSGDPHVALGSLGLFAFDVVVVVSMADLSSAEKALDALIAFGGDGSVLAALRDDQTLGGKASAVLVDGWSDYGVVEINGIEYLGARVAVRVKTTY